MSDDLDGSKIVAELVSKYLERGAETGLQIAADNLAKLKTRWKIGFGRYLDVQFKRYSKIKTLLYRDTPVPLRKLYVSARLKEGDKAVSEQSLLQKFDAEARLVVLGTAGLGKSLLMRSIFLSCVEGKKAFIPTFVELRDLNTENANSIKQHVYAKISEHVEDFTEKQFEHGLRNGLFGLILDGFDEIDFERLNTYEKELIEIGYKYPSAPIIISSRPEERIASWGSYSLFHLPPMQKAQIIDLIQRVDFEPVAKQKFTDAIRKGLYERHEDFLSTPLLATMMLLTFEQHAEIPEKMHIFYEQAFNALFHKHDATKELYVRKRYTKLPIDHFRRILAIFSALTYKDEAFTFSEVQLRDYLKESISIEKTSVDVEAIINDLLKSICILQRDGQKYQFSHRSFQEYFCALFLASEDPQITARMIDKIIHRAALDGVIIMLRDINQDLFERSWAIPALKKLNTKLSDIDPAKNARMYYKALSEKLILDDGFYGYLMGFGTSQMGKTLAALKWLYDYYMPDDPIDISSLKNKRRALADKYLTGEQKRSYKIDELPDEFLNQLAIIESRPKEKKFISSLLLRLSNERESRQSKLLTRLT